MKNKKSVLIIIFSLLLTLACPIKVNAKEVRYFQFYSLWNIVVFDGFYLDFDNGDSYADFSYFLDNYFSPDYTIKLRYYPDDSTSVGVYDYVTKTLLIPSSTPTTSVSWYLQTLYEHSSDLSSIGLVHFTRDMVDGDYVPLPTPIPSFVPEATPIPTYVPGGGGGGGVAPSNTPMPLPPLEGDYFLFGVETDNYVHFGSQLPNEVVFAVPSFSYSLTSAYYEVKFSIPSSFILYFLYNYNDRFATSVGVAQSDSRYLSNDVLTVVFYPNGTPNPNNFSVTWEYGYIPTPRPTYTPVPLPQSTPIPTFNPNAPINPDFDYNLGQSVEFGQLPTLFSNVSELSYLFVTPFEFLVTNMWERWYILFLFPVVAIISAFIWERRN